MLPGGIVKLVAGTLPITYEHHASHERYWFGSNMYFASYKAVLLFSLPPVFVEIGDGYLSSHLTFGKTANK